MKPKLKNRRIRKTKKLIKDSLIALMYEKKVKDITIKDIPVLADLNHGTFYLHYFDIYVLLSQIEDEAIEHIQQMLQVFNAQSNASTYHLLKQLFNDFYKNKQLFQLSFTSILRPNF